MKGSIITAPLSPEGVTAICIAVQLAWEGAKAKATHVPFKWKGKPYVAYHTTFRLLVNTPDGQPVACRYD